MTVYDLHNTTITRLAQYAPVNPDNPVDDEGRVVPHYVTRMGAGTVTGRRACGKAPHRIWQLDVWCVAPSAHGVVWLVQRAVNSLDGYRPAPDTGILRDVSYTGTPTQEPGITPARFSKALTFTTTYNP
ncbi:hypothetical protein ACUH93_00565 [Dermabacteraceae bacterium P7006]